MSKLETISKTDERRTRAAAGWVLALLFVLIAGCGESAPRRGSVALPVDPSLVPAQSMIGSRPVARMMGDGGVPMDFFLGELIVVTDDQAKLDAFVARWGGTVVKSTDPAGGVARVHHVRLDPSAANVEQLVAELNAGAPDARGTFRSTNEAAAKLLAVALSEANKNGMTVTPNFVVAPDGLIDGTTNEAPTGDAPLYSRNVFEWPYMKRGGAQDIGVAEAWQVMERAGVMRNKVRIMILDGGFVENLDTPAVRNIVGDWNVPNPSKCGDNDCPWHGTMVTTAAMGRIDNGYGGAGPAAPVGELLAVPFETDFFALIWTLERIIGATIFGDPRIINVSSSMELDLGWDILVKASCLGLCPSPSETIGSIVAAVTLTNKLIFASAGNKGKDVDNDGASIEGSTVIPCELPTVICVGGMAHDSTRRADNSNFGSKSGDGSVAIYGPYSMWVGPDPDNLANHARLKHGTSFSSPFVAGVAALVWASNPALSNLDVWSIVRDTAHVGGVHDRGGNQRRVNAFGAVARVLAGAPPVITLNPSGSTAPLNREWSVVAAVADDGKDCPPVMCPLSYDPPPSRTVGNVAFYKFDSAGPKTITVTAADPTGQTASASVTVNVINSPPVVTIALPEDGASVPRDVPVQLFGIATDANQGDGPGPGSLGCKWSSSNASDVFANICNYPHVFTTEGTRTVTLTATDPQGLSASTSITVTVTPPPANFPPNIAIMTRGPSQPNYENGYRWTTAFSLTASADDPEGNVPLSYAWKATSFRPKSTTPYSSDNLIGVAPSFSWTPSAHNPSMFGTSGQLGNDCYDGQTVRITVEVSDFLGNKSSRTLPDIKVYRCILE